MSKTNSNCITSILIAVLNNKQSSFRGEFFKCIKKQYEDEDICIPKETTFYDGTHQPLLYKEMNGKEIDIIARIPGKRKPVLMIEVKANIWENLQESQSKKGEYGKTAKKYGIPLIYIIPKYYAHEEEIPEIARIIKWESILNIARSEKGKDDYFVEQIKNFVEFTDENKILSGEELELLNSNKLLNEVYETKKSVLEGIYSILKKRNEISSQENEYGVGWNYKYKNNNFFIGFNPYYNGLKPDYNKKYFFSLCIQETSSIEYDDKLYYEDGWYFRPIMETKLVEGDEKILNELRKFLKKEKIVISEDFRKHLCAFYTLQAKLKNLIASYIKNEPYQINEDDGNIEYFFDDANYFLGLKSILSFGIHKEIVAQEKCNNLLKIGDYYAFQLSDETCFKDFLKSSTEEELQKNFNKLVDAAKKKADKYLKK